MAKKPGKTKTLDPRQIEFLRLYLDPASATFSNALQSALKAGFAQEYAESLTSKLPDWLSENVGDMRKLQKAEKNLEDMLDMDPEQQVVTMIGPLFDKKTKKPIKKINPNLLKIKQDTSKFIAERLGKNKYSLKMELGGNVNYQPVIELPPLKPHGKGNKDNLETATGTSD